MIHRMISYDADGIAMEGQLFVSEGGPAKRPGVLVFPEGFGLAEAGLKRARMLADLGYAAFACDLHGGGQRIHGTDEIMARLKPLREPARARARAGGALDALLQIPEVDHSNIAAIGYCIGGLLALELARGGAELKGVVGFHSSLSTTAPADAANITGKVLICLGADDPSVDSAQRTDFEQEMRAAKVNWQMNVYGGVVHAFTNVDAAEFGRPEVLRYDAQADARSWAEMRAFLEEVFN